MQYRDVVLHTNVGIFGKAAELQMLPPLDRRLDLSDRIWIGRLEGDIAKSLLETCEPRTVGLGPIFRQFSQLYAFVREVEQIDDEPYGWDRGNELGATIALSRLIQPTSVGFTYAARVGYDKEGLKQMYPAQITGTGKDVFLSPNHTRDWLTEPEAASLRELIPNLHSQLPKRIHSALWHHEYVARTYYLDYRWTLVCTGLEALVHTDRYHSTAQFSKRVPALAVELGIDISESAANEGYDLRSRLAHGASFLSTGTSQDPSAMQLELYDKLETILRLSVLRGMRDKSFSDIFSDDARIRDRWPI
jgi:hypothetical protein